MKRILITAISALLLTACSQNAPAQGSAMEGMQCMPGMMKDCPCCQHMMKEGKECCCKGMMKKKHSMKQSPIPGGGSPADHQQHY